MSAIYEYASNEYLMNVDEEFPCPYSHLLGDIFSQHPSFSLSQSPWNPPTDIYETEDAVIIKMDLAGLNHDSIDVNQEDNILTIQGERNEDTSETKKTYHLMEINYGFFQRAFRLSPKLTGAEIKAAYKEGFLVISIPKSNKKPDSIKIESD
jgi:HSP20 family protein